MAVAIAMASGCAAGQGWTHANTALELGFAGEVAFDSYQTAAYIVPTCSELNPVVGRCGDRVPLMVYAPVSVALHAVIAWALPPRWRDAFQAVSVGAEGIAVGLNWSTQDGRAALLHQPAVKRRR